MFLNYPSYLLKKINREMETFTSLTYSEEFLNICIHVHVHFKYYLFNSYFIKLLLFLGEYHVGPTTCLAFRENLFLIKCKF